MKLCMAGILHQPAEKTLLKHATKYATGEGDIELSCQMYEVTE
jgi:hypothetical protein